MQIEQRRWNESSGWVLPLDRGLKDKAQLVFLFGERDVLKTEKALRDIKAFYPSACVVGCSTAGEILGRQVFDGSMALTAVHFEKTPLRSEWIDLAGAQDSFQAGEELAGRLMSDDLRHVFVLSEGINVNGSRLAQGFSARLPRHVGVTGGLAGDQDRFRETVVVMNGRAASNMVVAVGFYGRNIKVGYGSMGGWDSFGPDRQVTQASGNIVYQLDGQPALELYKKYLGDQAGGLPATGLHFPLSLRGKGPEMGLVRTILSIDEKEGSLTFAGDVPQGSVVRLMKANFERLVDGACGAAVQTVQSLGSFAPQLAILISCVGRKLVLKQRVEEEVESVQETLGQQSQLTGFYSYGELCPLIPATNQCELHNQTMTVTAFSE